MLNILSLLSTKTNISRGLAVDLQVKSAVNIEEVLQFVQMTVLELQRSLSSFVNDAKLVVTDKEREIFTDAHFNHPKPVQPDSSLGRHSDFSFDKRICQDLSVGSLDQPTIIFVHKRLNNLLAIFDDS